MLTNATLAMWAWKTKISCLLRHTMRHEICDLNVFRILPSTRNRDPISTSPEPSTTCTLSAASNEEGHCLVLSSADDFQYLHKKSGRQMVGMKRNLEIKEKGYYFDV